MQQSYLDTDIGKAEFQLLRNQEHVDKVWSVMEPIVDQYMDCFLEGISNSKGKPTPQDNFTVYLQRGVQMSVCIGISSKFASTATLLHEADQHPDSLRVGSCGNLFVGSVDTALDIGEVSHKGTAA